MTDTEPPQMSLAQLKRLHAAGKPEEIVAALTTGRLRDVLAGEPKDGARERLR